jgi:DNA-binding winged helix-turn-helix (wHTH) protein
LKIIRFAGYEADLRSGELRLQGNRIRLQEKPFQVLGVLLSHPGEVVTREELRQRVWPADTFVDFEHGLNTAVNKLREALRDSAASPKFIETLPKRGYRFIGAVEPLNGNAGNPGSSTTSDFQSAPHAEGARELPRVDRRIARGLLFVIELGYFISYIASLHYANWIGMLSRFSFGPKQSITIASCIILWCAMGLPLRLYLLFALAFDYHLLATKFRRLYPFVLGLDIFWAGMALFLVPGIGLGFAFALFVAAVYSPFAQRTLVRMAYGTRR